MITIKTDEIMMSMNEFKTDIAFHPGETLSEKLEELRMGPKEFAVRSGKPEKTIIAIMKGESSITPEMAMIFESVLKIPARFWIKRQASFDEYRARKKRAEFLKKSVTWAKLFPIAEMAKCGWLPYRTRPEERVAELLQFFGISSPEAWEDYFFNQQLKVSFRISLHQSKEPYAISAWIRQGEIQAAQLQCGKYSENLFKGSLHKIKTIMAKQPNDFFEKLQKICLECGVKLVYTPCIKKAPLSGATRWIGENPLIQLTGRYKQNDRFWFTFFHEAGHILKHGKKDIFLEDIEYSNLDLEKEKEADEFAVEWTLSNEEEREVRDALPLGKDEIKYFAKKFNTHPAIIIGRLHKKGLLPYSKGREFIVKLDF